MIDIFTIKPGDRVEYGPYLCSKGLENERSYGIYRDFAYWSPDERPIELWLDLTRESESGKGMSIRIRASQVTNVYPMKV